MPDKPRVKAPKQRSAPAPGGSARGRSPLFAAAAALAALGAVGAVLAFVSLGGGGRPSEDEVRANLEAAGCTLEAKPALPGEHSVTDPSGSSPKWNTDPPTSGPHYAQAAIFGIYEEPLELARVVHNLEHGGVFILWGEDVPPATVDELRAFYAQHKTGTIMAPLPRLGDEFALGAWVSDGDTHKGYLAKCKAFDEVAVSSFFRAFQFRGPERFDPSALQPGS
ncbi:MAG TPA: DUF3105 domain-containing protein [Gaiellaceae bacterium]|jgi:hypothetical protein|nr:DUF3105 domain-containing protein [Gaiellaceae bacterium]